MTRSTCTECLNDRTARAIVRCEKVHNAATAFLASLVAGPVVGVVVGGLLTWGLETVGMPKDSAISVGMTVWALVGFGLPGFCGGRLWALWTDRE